MSLSVLCSKVLVELLSTWSGNCLLVQVNTSHSLHHQHEKLLYNLLES